MRTRIKSRRVALMLVLVTLLAACSGGGSSSNAPNTEPPEPTERVAVLMGGHPHAKAITETGKATAFRITQDPDQDYKEVQIGDGVALTPEQRQELVALLADDGSYEWDLAKGCEPMPGVLITFEDGATYARVRICYSCVMVGFKPGSWEDFDPINQELIDWAKGVFPDDEAIQGLSVDGGNSGL